MSEVRHFAHTVRVAPRADVAVMVLCFFLTVVFDMVVAIGVGVVLAALLFMKRMSELTSSRILAPASQEDENRSVPPGVVVYEIAGPLFFGAASRAMAAIDAISADVRVVVLALGRVPVIDGSGIRALESALRRLSSQRKFVIIAGPLPEPRTVFRKARLEEHHENITFTDDLLSGLAVARDLVLLNPEWSATPLPASVHPPPAR
jgi:SulP family sulfate permease